MQVICAGSLDTFQIFVWATKTARLLDVLAAHEGPVVALAFSPTQPLLASGSWDKTVLMHQLNIVHAVLASCGNVCRIEGSAQIRSLCKELQHAQAHS